MEDNLKTEEENKEKINKLNKQIKKHTVIVFIKVLIIIAIIYFCWQTITCYNTGGRTD